MSCYKIVDRNKFIRSFWCRTCKHPTNVIYKDNRDTYCEKCVTKDVKERAVSVNQCREEIREWN